MPGTSERLDCGFGHQLLIKHLGWRQYIFRTPTLFICISLQYVYFHNKRFSLTNNLKWMIIMPQFHSAFSPSDTISKGHCFSTLHDFITSTGVMSWLVFCSLEWQVNNTDWQLSSVQRVSLDMKSVRGVNQASPQHYLLLPCYQLIDSASCLQLNRASRALWGRFTLHTKQN